MTHFSSFSLRYSSLDPISCEDLSEHVNVIYGSNEAGKSRVRDFLEWMMFASSDDIVALKTAAAKKAFAHLDPSISGTALIELGDEKVSLTQQFVDNISQAHVSSSTLRASDISRALTDGLSRNHYNKVFSLTLDELSREESNKLITEDEVMNMFFGASLTGSGISPPALLSELTKQRDEMYSEAKQAKNKKINRILKELNNSSTLIKQLRQKEKGLETIDSDLVELHKKLSDIDARIVEIRTHITEKSQLIENADDFDTYELLSSTPKPTIDSELISRIMDINMLVHTCKELLDQGDQKEKDRITSTLSALKDQHSLQYNELSLTISPDSLDPTVRSPHFLSVIESENRNHISYTTEIKAIKDQIAQYTNDLGLLTKASEQLVLDINKATSPPQENVVPISPAPTSQRTSRIGGIVASVFGIALFVAGFVLALPALWITGAVLACAAGAYALLSAKSAANHVIEIPASNELYVQQMNRELNEKHAAIQDLNSRINTLLDEQKKKDAERELTNQTYISALTSAGFPSGTTPQLASIYLDSFKDYAERSQRLTDLDATLTATRTRLDAIFARAENLREIARGTECETSIPFETLEDIHVWAKSLHDIAVEQKKQEENVHLKDNQLREIEKRLCANFSSIENARNQYSRTSLDDVRAELDDLVRIKDEIEGQRKEIDHDIVRLDEQRRAASSSTEIADETQRSQQLIDELRELHAHYRGLYVAHKTVSHALDTFRQDNQPELLRVASSMLSTITRGEWNHVTIEQELIGKNEPVIRIIGDRAPHGISITQLSRGTREQLYLCLRLALMQTSSRGKHVPALFDDIAVNSDRARFEALAPVIREIGRDRQVIYFTCHETTRDILAEYAGARIHTI